jgi:hypothetical protein
MTSINFSRSILADDLSRRMWRPEFEQVNYFDLLWNCQRMRHSCRKNLTVWWNSDPFSRFITIGVDGDPGARQAFSAGDGLLIFFEAGRRF